MAAGGTKVTSPQEIASKLLRNVGYYNDFIKIIDNNANLITIHDLEFIYKNKSNMTGFDPAHFIKIYQKVYEKYEANKIYEMGKDTKENSEEDKFLSGTKGEIMKSLLKKKDFEEVEKEK